VWKKYSLKFRYFLGKTSEIYKKSKIQGKIALNNLLPSFCALKETTGAF
jgi:hypothetical protein